MCDSATTGCFFTRSSSSKENGRSVPDLTASPGRAPPGPMPSHQAQGLQQQQQHQQHQQQGMQGHHQQHQQQRQGSKEPVLLQGDFRKVSGISSEIFRQIEAVENDHDPSTAAALEVVERRGEMIVRILEPRCMGSRQAIEAGQKFLNKSDARHTVQLVEIVKRPGQTLGLYIREGNGADRSDGVFISRIALESAVYNSGCLRVGDEILAVNLVDVTRMSLDDVVIIMSIPRRLVLAIRQRRGNRGANSPGPPQMSRPEQKPPPVVVIKRDLRDEDLDDSDRAPRSSRSSRERRTGDGREMTESRSRLGLGLNNYSPQSEQLDMYYGGGGGGGRHGPGGGAVETPSWGYKPPPPPSVITEQPKGMHGGGPGGGGGGFHTSHSYYQNAGTLESLAEKVHAFYPSATTSRRMSAGGAGVAMSQSHQRFPRSGSDQHLPRVEYADYASLGRHPLLARSSLKNDLVGAAPIAGGTLGRYGRYDGGQPGQPGHGTSRTAKYGPSPLGATGSLQRRSRPALDYSSDTEATIGPRPSYYYYNHPAMAGGAGGGGGSGGGGGTMGRGSTQALGGGPEFAKFNSLPRERPGARLGLRGRIVDRLQDEADGNVSAPEYSLPIRRDLRDLRHRITASPSIFTSDEYRAWLRRAPSSSAICEQMRASRDLLNQQRAHRFSCSAENIHDVLKNTEHIYSSRTGLVGPGGVGGVGGVGMGGTLDRHSLAAGGPRMSSLPVRSLSSQHIGGPSSIRSPSVRRMRQLLELTQQGAAGLGGVGGGIPSSVVAALAGHQSPAPTPSTTLPRSHRQIDINPAEYTKYKLDKPVVDAVGMSGMLWIHLLAGRGLRAMSDTPSQLQQPLIRDLYCVLECDRIHKARTVVRSGDLQFDWDESFELDLVCNKQLDVLVYSWDPQHRHKLCYRGALSLTTLLRQSPIHQLALKVEPRGTIYLRLRHTDPFQLFRRRGLPSLRGNVPALFGADLETVVTRESKGAPGCAPVPIILRRCVEEVERRGLDIIGLYRLCGSATKKRLLREAFERNSRAVELTPEHVPDINVITGVLKDYLRELPEPLFTKCLFQMTVDALGVCLPDDPEGNAKLMLSILDCLPRANRATLVFLLDHLSLVVSASERNKMSAQALATALGPPLMLHSASVGANEEIDHAQPIAVLKYLLQIWPQPGSGAPGATGVPTSGRRGEPVEPRGNKASALQVGKSAGPQQPLPPASSQHQRSSSSTSIHQLSSRSSSSTNLVAGSASASASAAAAAAAAAAGSSSNSHSSHSNVLASSSSSSIMQSSALASIQPRSAASNPSTTSSTLGQHLLSATPSTLQYQSVVAQLAQSHRALQQAGQQPHQSEVSAGLAERVQSPHHATPSPSSSSTSSASGSGSGTDTIKRGASPASVKFKESTSSYSLKSDTQSRSILSGQGGSKQQGGPSLYSTGSNGLGYGSGTNGSSLAADLLHGGSRASGLFASSAGDYLSSTSSIASSVASSTAAAAGGGGPVSSSSLYAKMASVAASAAPSVTSTLNITTFSLDEKNNLVVSPSPSSASESSYRSSSPASSIQRDKSPNSLGDSGSRGAPTSGSPSPLRRQEQFERVDSAPVASSSSSSSSSAAAAAAAAAAATSSGTATTTASSGGSFMSSLRSQTLGSYQFPSSSLKLTSQLGGGGSQDSQDDGSTSSLLRKLTSSLSRTIVSNTGTLPLSLGREKLSELSGSGSGSGSGGSYASGGIGSISSSISGPRTMSSSLGYSGVGSASSALDGGASSSAGSGGGGGGGGVVGGGMSSSGSVTSAAAVTSMNIYGTLPKTHSSIYSAYAARESAGATSVSASGSALSGLLSGTTSSYGISERLRALTTGGGSLGADGSTGSTSIDSGAASSSAGDLESSAYDYESSGFSSASYSGMATSGASIGSGGGLSSSYFSTGSTGNSPFAAGASTTGETSTAGAGPYRVQYASTNPFLPSFNPTGDGSNGSRGDSKPDHDDEPFDMK